MNKKEYFTIIKTNLEILRKIGVNAPEGEYLCPVCLSPFNENELSNLTEEDVPQASLGGSRITLTCRNCNSNCGALIDVHLLESLKFIEQQEFLPNTDRKVSLMSDSQKLNAKLEVSKYRDLKLVVSTKRNSPKVWDDFRENKLVPGAIVDVQDAPLKHQQERIEAAIIKNAYLLLFAKTGFTILSHSYYDSFRNLLLDPDNFQLPVRLWTQQNIICSDGIFKLESDSLKGFFISFTLYLKKSYKYFVFIPIPNSDFAEVKRFLANIVPGKGIQLFPFDINKNYLTDEAAIRELRKWCGIDN